MGQLFASQLHRAICKSHFSGQDPKGVIYNGNAGVGAFMKEKVFMPGRLYSWNALTKFATGEELNAKSFALDFQAN
jgi:Zn-dependent M32 family carboxypeptidase